MAVGRVAGLRCGLRSAHRSVGVGGNTATRYAATPISPTPSGGEVGNLRTTKTTDHASATYNASLDVQSPSVRHRSGSAHGGGGAAGSGGGGDSSSRGKGRGRRRAVKRLQQAVQAAAATAAGAAAHAAEQRAYAESLYRMASYKRYGDCDDVEMEAQMEAGMVWADY